MEIPLKEVRLAELPVANLGTAGLRGLQLLSHLIRQVGGRPRLVPSPLAKVALDQLWKLRISDFPAQELDHLRYVCMVDDARARAELGYEPAYSIDRVLKDVRRLRYQMG